MSRFVVYFSYWFVLNCITEIFGYCKLYRDYRQPFFNSIFPFSLSFSYCGSLYTDDTTFAYDSAVRLCFHIHTHAHTHTEYCAVSVFTVRAALFYTHSFYWIRVLRIHTILDKIYITIFYQNVGVHGAYRKYRTFMMSKCLCVRACVEQNMGYVVVIFWFVFGRTDARFSIYICFWYCRKLWMDPQQTLESDVHEFASMVHTYIYICKMYSIWSNVHHSQAS